MGGSIITSILKSLFFFLHNYETYIDFRNIKRQIRIRFYSAIDLSGNLSLLSICGILVFHTFLCRFLKYEIWYMNISTFVGCDSLLRE